MILRIFHANLLTDRHQALIDWAKKQIEMYAERFRKQVYSSDVEQQTIKEALKITYSQSRKVCLLSPPSIHTHLYPCLSFFLFV